MVAMHGGDWRRGAWRAAGLALAAGTLLTGGCVWDEASVVQTTTLSAPYTEGTGLRVEARNGSVSVREGAGEEIVVAATLKMKTQERVGQVTLVADQNDDGVLMVYAKPPPGGWKSSEGCSFDVTVPSPMPVDLRTGNGAVECAGMRGEGVFETSNGSVTVLGHDGPVRARTSNGRVEVLDVAGPIEARTSNGNVVVRLAKENAGPVRIATSNGSVTLDLGPAFRGEMTVRTSNGSVRIPAERDGVDIVKRGKRSATVRFGDGGEASSVSTSNGSVTVRR